jgi:hypothetical protein
MKPLLVLISGFLMTGFFFSTTSCKKDTECKATVKCIDSVGNAVGNADVILFAVVKDPNDPKGTTTHTADVKANGVTDVGGEVSFTFKLPAIYDIKATASSGNKSITGLSIIKLEEGKSVSKTVTLK